jgi:EmrB/QacA subfamily drug resistance transporter
MTTTQRSVLSTRRGVLTLLLLCAVQFMDVVDSSIMNVALPSIRDDLHFSQQRLQWVLSGYLVTYGGFLLLGGRAADVLGRRRLLVAGTVLFAACSLVGGLAPDAGVLVGARVAQGVGAALMAPAGLSILTTTFVEGRDRTRALGVWGAISGVAAAAGVFLGGVLSEGPGWRWVLLVNIPICVAIVAAAFALVPGERLRVAGAGGFDVPGAVLVTAAMLVLVYGLVKAPDAGWGARTTIGELGTAAVLLAAFVAVERRGRNPLFPFGILRIKGVAAADLTQLVAFAGFLSVFFFLTLHLQGVLGWSPIRSGSAYLPVTAGIVVTAGVCTRLMPRTGTRPVVVTGALLAAAGMYLLSGVPADASYVADLLPGLVVMSIGLGAVFIAVTTAANAGVPADEAGFAAGLLNTSLQLGSALGLAIFSAVATARTGDALAGGATREAALTAGYGRAILAAAIALLVAAVVALRLPGGRGVTAAGDGTGPAPAAVAAGAGG